MGIARVLALLLLCCDAQNSDTPNGGAPCADEVDCSYGGVCNTSAVCDCDAAWTGPRCDLLNLQRASPHNGLQVSGYHSWGGHSVRDDAGLYHGFFSFMCRHATLSEWTTKSSIYRATATAPDGPYSPVALVAQPWSHNAMISRAPDGTYVLFQIGDAQADPSLWQPCFNASEATPDFALVSDAPFPSPSTRDAGSSVYVRSAPTPEGPWTPLNDNAPLEFDFSSSWASAVNGGNPAPLFFPNGSILLYFSANPCPPHWGNTVPGNNCIGVARGSSWKGPFFVAAANPLPVTHPESEDAHVFVDGRGHYHLLTNVNNDHARCAAGVACGGHAWSADGLTFSNLTIGAFGPVVRLTNGTFIHNAYVERPQVTLSTDGVTPLAFFVGMGRTSYYDSVSWVQLFCTEKHSSECGPTLPPLPPPPPPAIRLRYTAMGGCLTFNATSLANGIAPCWGGDNYGCTLFISDCAADASAWRFEGGGLFSAATLPASIPSLSLNFDCNALTPTTPAWAFGPTGGSNTQALALVGDTLRAPGTDACLGVSSVPPRTPCGPEQRGLDLSGAVRVLSCTDAAAQGWAVVMPSELTA